MKTGKAVLNSSNVLKVISFTNSEFLTSIKSDNKGKAVSTVMQTSRLGDVLTLH